MTDERPTTEGTTAKRLAQERAHRLTPRCTGGAGYGPGGDGSRYHSAACDRLAFEFEPLLAEIERLRVLLREAVDDMRTCDDDTNLISRIREALAND